MAHSPDSTRTIANLARVLRRGGRLVLVDDVPDDALADDDPDLASFRAGWRCPALARRSTLIDALGAAGLSVDHEDDLTRSSCAAIRRPSTASCAQTAAGGESSIRHRWVSCWSPSTAG